MFYTFSNENLSKQSRSRCQHLREKSKVKKIASLLLFRKDAIGSLYYWKSPFKCFEASGSILVVSWVRNCFKLEWNKRVGYVRYRNLLIPVLRSEAKIILFLGGLWFPFATRMLLPVAVPLPWTSREPCFSPRRAGLGFIAVAHQSSQLWNGHPSRATPMLFLAQCWHMVNGSENMEELWLGYDFMLLKFFTRTSCFYY